MNFFVHGKLIENTKNICKEPVLTFNLNTTCINSAHRGIFIEFMVSYIMDIPKEPVLTFNLKLLGIVSKYYM